MTTKLILLSLLLITACGREVKYDKATQESYSNVTQAGSNLTELQGIFLKQSTLNSSTITYGGKTYSFSEYSSAQAYAFYDSRVNGSSTPVRFRGEVKKEKLQIETISAL